MLPLIAAAAAPLIAGAFGAAGQKSANEANARQAKESMAFSAAEAEKNRSFQKSMSDTSWQRAVKDIEAAGLNPALAYGQGGASSPGGSTASGTAAHMESSLGAGVSSALSAARMKSDMVAGELSNDRIGADIAESVARAKLTSAQANQVSQMTEHLVSEMASRSSLTSIRAGTASMEQQREAERWRQFEQPSFEDRLRALKLNLDTGAAKLPGYKAGSTLSELMIPQARNAAGAANTAWGRYVSPYLNDAGAVARIFTPWNLGIKK